LRLEQRRTLQSIASKYGISRERVRQIVGNTGYIGQEIRDEYIKSQRGKTNDELAEELGLSFVTISRKRSNIHHAVSSDCRPVFVGHKWEEWAHYHLLKNGIKNKLMGYKSPYDIMALGNIFIDVKVTTKTSPTSNKIKSPQYRFRPNINHNKADLYMLIIAPTEDVFIVPDEIIGNMQQVAFCWPSKRPEIGKIQKYHNRLDLIWKAHNKKMSGG
jgi:hypothetical protein